MTDLLDIVSLQNELRPLGLSSGDYENILRESPPKNLGIGLILLTPTAIEIDEHIELIYEFSNAYKAFRELAQYEEFRAEFLPPIVKQVEVVNMKMDNTTSFINNYRYARFLPCSHGASLQVVLFDADIELEEHDLPSLMFAFSYLDGWIQRHRTYEPIAHIPIWTDSARAKDYYSKLGDAFSSDLGIWCEPLVGFRSALMTAIESHMAGGSIVSTMRSFSSSGKIHYADLGNDE